MSQQEQYELGKVSFNNGIVYTQEELKQCNPLFRTGYKAAQQAAMLRNNNISPTVLFDVPKRPEIFKPTWVDIMSAMKRPRYHRLHSTEGRWLMFGIAKHIETRTSEIKRYKDVLNMVDEAFDYVLQYGYDEGVLTAQDCEQYNYTPKPVIANKE